MDFNLTNRHELLAILPTTLDVREARDVVHEPCSRVITLSQSEKNAHLDRDVSVGPETHGRSKFINAEEVKLTSVDVAFHVLPGRNIAAVRQDAIGNVPGYSKLVYQACTKRVAIAQVNGRSRLDHCIKEALVQGCG
jgi:hypothetical protein